jgi:hypothetical protein
MTRAPEQAADISIPEHRAKLSGPGETWDGLRELKRRYDPDNPSRLNHNVPPAGA